MAKWKPLFLIIVSCLYINKINCDIPQDTTDKIDAFLEQLLTCRDIVGINLAVVHKGSTFTTGYGVTDLKTNVKVNNSTLFNVASVSKAFATTLLGQLLKEQK